MAGLNPAIVGRFAQAGLGLGEFPLEDPNLVVRF
jgi:hypothetical protein